MASEESPKRTCFVVMGFGKKTDFETGRTLDLDKTYKEHHQAAPSPTPAWNARAPTRYRTPG